MNISENGRIFIHNFEGFRGEAYDDLQPNKKITNYNQLKGTLTIGYGFTGSWIKPGMVITRKEADNKFVQIIKPYENAVNALKMNLNQNEFDALVSFCYNCGVGNLNTLCSDRNKASIRKWLPAYNKSGGNVLAGLTRRRNAELQLFNTPVKNSVTTVSKPKEKDEYFVKAPKRVVAKVEIGLYKDVNLKHKVRTYNAGTPFTIKSLEKSDGGAPRLLTASGFYISANKRFVK